MIALLVGVVAAQTSQPPAPRLPVGKSSQPQQHAAATQQKPDADPRGTDQSPLTVKILPTAKTHEEAAKEQADRDDQSAANWWMVRLTAAVSFVGVLQLLVFGYQALKLKHTIAKMDEIAAAQTKDTQAAIQVARDNATAGKDTADALAATLSANREAERAYVTISHVTPHSGQPGYQPLDYTNEPDKVWFWVEIRNHGRTPADVLGGIITVELGPVGSMPPEIPTRGFAKIPPAFLVPNDWIRFHSLVFPFDPADLRRAGEPLDASEDAEPLEMWLVGYVIYQDQFGGIHCGGYGRHWDRYTHDLIFDKTTAALNYDRAPTDQYKYLGQP